MTSRIADEVRGAVRLMLVFGWPILLLGAVWLVLGMLLLLELGLGALLGLAGVLPISSASWGAVR